MNKYLLRIWKGDVLIKDLEWETDNDYNKLHKEVSESTPVGVRITIENVKRANEKTRWYSE